MGSRFFLLYLSIYPSSEFYNIPPINFNEHSGRLRCLSSCLTRCGSVFKSSERHGVDLHLEILAVLKHKKMRVQNHSESCLAFSLPPLAAPLCSMFVSVSVKSNTKSWMGWDISDPILKEKKRE